MVPNEDGMVSQQDGMIPQQCEAFKWGNKNKLFPTFSQQSGESIYSVGIRVSDRITLTLQIGCLN